MKIDIFNESGKQTGKKANLSEKVFNIEPHDHAIWLDVRSVRANQRQGTHNTKGRSDVSGGGRKPFRQKGTGRARQGTIRAPHHVGGGRVFGPHPRNYRIKITKKLKTLARKSALSYKSKAKNVFVVEDFSYEEAKTNRFVKFLNALDVGDNHILLLTGQNELNIYQSTKNLYKVEIRDSYNFSTYDILRAEKLILQESAVEKINEVLG
jgi:large subunit ribosomal protein L4